MGLTNPQDSRIVEEGLEKFPELKAELDEIEITLEKYAMDHSVEPGAQLKEKLLHTISEQKTLKETGKENPPGNSAIVTVYRIPAYFKIAIAASILLLLGSLGLTYSFYTKYTEINNTYQTVQSKMQKDLNANEAMKHDLAVMGDKNAVPVVLKGTAHAPDALAKIYWMKNTGEVYVDPSNLPSAPPGKQYQLWAIVDGKPVDAGMIRTENGIFHIQKMKSFGNAQAFAITMEKTGGSPTPSMDQMFVMAKI